MQRYGFMQNQDHFPVKKYRNGKMPFAPTIGLSINQNAHFTTRRYSRVVSVRAKTGGYGE